MKRQTRDTPVMTRNNERGAALITTILLSTMLLTAGGILILITAMSGTNAVDATAEMQAYYAAEAGVSRTLKVLRGNERATDGSTLASFRNIVSDRTKWTSIAGTKINVDASSAFVVDSIIDPDDVDGSVRAANTAYKPQRLKIQVTGYGPKSSTKRMEFIVNRFTTNFAVNSTITLPNGSGTAFNFNIGDSNVTAYSGLDASGNPAPPIAAFGIAGSDYSGGQNVINGCQQDGTGCNGQHPNVIPTTPMMLDASNTPSFLRSVPSARSFLYGGDGMMNMAASQGRYFTNTADAMASPGAVGANNPNGMLTFVDGNFTLGPGSPTGQGLLIVTGDLTLNGNFQWNGVIMVLGAGRVFRSGGGHGDVFGAMFIATFPRSGPDSDVFQPPTFDTSGGGTANIQYNSDEIDRAKGVGGHKVVGMREY